MVAGFEDQKQVKERAELLLEVQQLEEELKAVAKEKEKLSAEFIRIRQERMELEAKAEAEYSAAREKVEALRAKIAEEADEAEELRGQLREEEEALEMLKRATDADYRKQAEEKEAAEAEKRAKEQAREEACQEIQELAEATVFLLEADEVSEDDKALALENYKRATWIARNLEPPLSYSSGTSKVLKKAKSLLDSVLPEEKREKRVAVNGELKFKNGNSSNALQAELMGALGV